MEVVGFFEFILSELLLENLKSFSFFPDESFDFEINMTVFFSRRIMIFEIFNIPLMIQICAFT